MSTWETESIRGEHYQSVASIPGITRGTWEAFVRKCPVTFSGGMLLGYKWANSAPQAVTQYYPLGDAADLLEDKTGYGTAFNDIYWQWAQARIGKKRGLEDAEILTTVLRAYDSLKWKCGLEAVHEVAFNPGTWLASCDADALRYVLTFTREAMVGLCEAPRYTPAVAQDQFELVDASELNDFVTHRLYAENIRAVYKMRFANKKKKRTEDGSTLNKYLHRGVKMFYIGSLTILVHRKVVCVLTMADCDRIQQMLVSRAMLHMYLATVNAGGNFPYRELRAAVLLELDILRDTCLGSTYMQLQKVCKYYKKAMDLYQSYLAGELADDRRKDLADDLLDAPSSMDATAFVMRLKRRSLEIAQESGKIYRILCAPDYDIGEAYLKRAKQLHLPNPKGPHVNRNVPLDLDDFRKYHASMLLDATARMNGGKGVGTPIGAPPAWWDEWVLHGKRPGGIDWVDTFNWEGAVRYRERDATDPEVWKDSTTCEEEWVEAMAPRENPRTLKRNMLTRLLRDEDCPMPDTARREITREYHLLRAGFKMEAHKDVARIFYIGNLSDRLFGSEIENNIARVAAHVSGYTVGAPIADIVRRIGRCYAPTVAGSSEVYHISSDYEAWSPGMHGNVQRVSHANWAKLFGKPEIKQQRHINEYSWLLLNKRGYTGAVQNAEANYEGLNGKEMTVIHCAMVGYTIYRARLGGLKIPIADFAAFIDDGALTVVMPREPGHTTFKQFWGFYVETTAFLGYKLDVAKCYLSTRFLIYLNEVYYGGRHIAHGLRAVMRIGTRTAKRGETISDILEAAGAGCRGASKCGISSVQIWKCCIIVHAVELYIRFQEEVLSARATVFFAYAPRILGGLQAPIGLTLDCNFSGSGATESLAYIKTYLKYNEEVRTWYLKLARTSVRQCSGPTLIRNYRTVSPTGASLLSDYVSPAIRHALDGFVTSSFGDRLVLYGTVHDDKEIGESILKNTAVISATVLATLDKSLISSVFTAFLKKFESSSTMQKILGARRLYAIERAIEVDEWEYLRTFRARIVRQ